MIVGILFGIAACFLFWDVLLERLRQAAESPWLRHLELRHFAGIALLVGAAWYGLAAQSPATPAPPPPSPAALSLTGLFRGATAAADAATLASLCESLADCIEYDAGLESPRLKSGVAVAELRAAARDARMRGVSIGDRQPAVRDAISAYMSREDVLGREGGPLDAAQRNRWVQAFRTVAQAAEAAVR